jgi:hypothetical protein
MQCLLLMCSSDVCDPWDQEVEWHRYLGGPAVPDTSNAVSFAVLNFKKVERVNVIFFF